MHIPIVLQTLTKNATSVDKNDPSNGRVEWHQKNIHHTMSQIETSIGPLFELQL
jgi:hypothetical protein